MATYQERLTAIFDALESKRRELRDLATYTPTHCQKHIHYATGALLDAGQAVEKMLNQTPAQELKRPVS